MFDWDDLRIFLNVARTRRVATAARALAVDPTTVQRRLARLEQAVGAALFELDGGERRLTERGHALFLHAEAMESAAISAMGDTGRLAGQVRISVPEGFASGLLTPNLRGFHESHPDIRLDLVSSSGFLNPSKREADIAVMFARPRTGPLVAAKLGDYRLRLYGSADYFAKAGTPRSVEDLQRHTLIGYVPEFLYAPELDYLGEIGAGLEPSVRSTSINIQHQLIASGVGLGVLHAFTADGDARLVPVMADKVEIRRSFWLVVHSDVRRLARIEAVTDWLKQCAARLG